MSLILYFTFCFIDLCFILILLSIYIMNSESRCYNVKFILPSISSRFFSVQPRSHGVSSFPYPTQYSFRGGRGCQEDIDPWAIPVLKHCLWVFSTSHKNSSNTQDFFGCNQGPESLSGIKAYDLIPIIMWENWKGSMFLTTNIEVSFPFPLFLFVWRSQWLWFFTALSEIPWI